MKLVSWNVNGIRAALHKGFVDYVKKEKPDILSLQEVKLSEPIDIGLPYKHVVWHLAEKKGYSGTAMFSKTPPLKVWYDIKGHSGEGRVINAEFSDFILVTVYTPNAQRGLTRLNYRQKWDTDFLNHITSMKKPVIVCGDLNVAHKEIDIARPKANRKNAGFTDEERAGMDAYIAAGYVDSFREFSDEPGQYSWWSYMGNARRNNVGWRIDYYLVQEVLKKKLAGAFMRQDVFGSDHCPVGITLK